LDAFFAVALLACFWLIHFLFSFSIGHDGVKPPIIF
jgi:hypothetical protein